MPSDTPQRQTRRISNGDAVTKLHRLLDTLRPGDVLVVWKLDRLSRSLKDLLTLLERLDGLDVGFRSLTEHIDTTTPAGRMLLQMLGAFAEFEREMVWERTREGLAAARADGRVGGRKPKLSQTQRDELVRGVREERYTMAQAARLFGVHPATVSRLMSQVHVAETARGS
ncbi:recombinase family protein [Deinococcus frigens]|uniref:recombinase family protein n=1 Tax=Deinococcus frigens TaxID=249403 RepID=UPI000B0040D1|nr:recombinase family protein [Deinococcus frigens]